MFPSRIHVWMRTFLNIQCESTLNAKFNIIVAGMCSTSVAPNYYQSLGVPKNCTQTDIKAAYYKLSMQFHPDRNSGSESAANKFREITQAYEILGNYKLRRLYDKGIIHKSGQRDYSPSATDDLRGGRSAEMPDDPETKFYKSRFKRSTVANASGRTPIYDFDEWSRAHYGEALRRRQTAKTKWTNQQADRETARTARQNEYLIFAVGLCASFAYLSFIMEPSYDTPKEKAKNTSPNNDVKKS